MLLVPAASVPKHATWDRQVQGEAIQATGVTGLGGLGISSSGLFLWWEDTQAEVRPIAGPPGWASVSPPRLAPSHRDSPNDSA